MGIWLVGRSSIGKLRLARETWLSVYLKSQNKWWDGFRSDPTRPALLDDLDCCGVCLSHHLKIWADKYSFLAEIKGGTISIRPSHMIITSNFSPRELFQEQHLGTAICRRFKIYTVPHFSTRPSDLNLLDILDKIDFANSDD